MSVVAASVGSIAARRPVALCRLSWVPIPFNASPLSRTASSVAAAGSTLAPDSTGIVRPLPSVLTWPSPRRVRSAASSVAGRVPAGGNFYSQPSLRSPALIGLTAWGCESRRDFAAAAKLSADAAKALGSIKDTMKKTHKKQIQLTKAQKRNLQGNVGRYLLTGGDKEEFHNVDRNKHGRIFEPWHNFEVVITSSKNNCWISVKNKGWKYRCVFTSHAGNVGFRKAMKKTEAATQRIALNVARKLKRLGVTCAEVTFRKIMKVDVCLQAFQAVGLQITKLTHVPRLPKGAPAKPRKQRRV